MGVVTDLVRVACQTSGATTTQDITASLGGLTPKACILVVSEATTDGTAIDEAVISVGFTDGTDGVMAGGYEQHNVTTTSTYSDYSASAVIEILDPTAGSVDGQAVLDSVSANTLTIDWTNYPSAAHLLTVLFIAGSDVTAKVDSHIMNDTVDVASSISGVGFEADDVLIALSAAASDGTPNIRFIMSLGFAHNDGVGGVDQCCTHWRRRNARAATTLRQITRNAAAIGEMAAASEDWYGEVSNFGSDGFDITARTNGANSREIVFLALNWGGAAESWVGVYSTPTSTGDDAETGPGIEPQAVILLPNLTDAVNTVYSDNRAGTVGISVFTDSAEYSTTVSSEEGAGTTNTQSLSDDRALVVPDDDGTFDIEAVFSSMDANGWTLTYSNVATAAKQLPAFVIGVESGGAPIEQSLAGAITPTSALLRQVNDLVSGAAGSTSVYQLLIGQGVSGALDPDGTEAKSIRSTLSGSIAPSGQPTGVLNQSISGVVSLTGAVLLTAYQFLAGILSLSAAILTAVGQGVSAALDPTGEAAKSIESTLGGQIEPSGGTDNLLSQLFAGSMAPVGALGTALFQALAGALSTSGAITTVVGQLLTGQIDPSGALDNIRAILQSLAGALGTSASLLAQVGQGLGGAFSAQGEAQGLPGQGVSGSLALTGTPAQQIAQGLLSLLSSAGSLSKEVGQGIGGAISQAGETVGLPSLVPSGAIAPAGSIATSVYHSLSGAISTILGALTNETAGQQYLSSTIGLTGALGTSLTQALGASAGMTGQVATTIATNITGLLTGGGTTASTYVVIVTGALSPTGSLARIVQGVVSGSLSLSSTLQGQIIAILSGLLSFAGNHTKRPIVALNGLLSAISGALSNVQAQAFAGSLVPIGAISKAIYGNIVGSIEGGGATVQRVYQTLAGSLPGLVGSLTNTTAAVAGEVGRLFKGMFRGMFRNMD